MEIQPELVFIKIKKICLAETHPSPQKKSISLALALYSLAHISFMDLVLNLGG